MRRYHHGIEALLNFGDYSEALIFSMKRGRRNDRNIYIAASGHLISIISNLQPYERLAQNAASISICGSIGGVELLRYPGRPLSGLRYDVIVSMFVNYAALRAIQARAE